eukprot:TRINITY_DN4062_c0_g1_i1.p1 TRINITY_DN4062_c0_g1~~TRINITY_DN4062_c0_g1_i1.p1  ORF type:complete len:247 (+),score=17.81 TRINITY_DN4062_c0_g1_i1:471-1211(+)
MATSAAVLVGPSSPQCVRCTNWAVIPSSTSTSSSYPSAAKMSTASVSLTSSASCAPPASTEGGASSRPCCHVSRHMSRRPHDVGWAAVLSCSSRQALALDLRPCVPRRRDRPRTTGSAGNNPAQLTADSSTTYAVLNVNEEDFEDEVLKSGVPVLVDFWASWCGPCKLVAPLMTWASDEYEGKIKVVKVEHDSNPGLVAKYKVYGLPTIMIFQNGEVLPGSHKEGALTKPKLQALLNEVLPSIAAM